MIRSIALLLLVGWIAACSASGDDSPLSATTPAPSRSTIDTLVAMALRLGYINERFVADSGVYQPGNIVIVAAEADTLPGRLSYILTPSALPASDIVSFSLMTGQELLRYANRHGDFEHASIGRIWVGGDTASIIVSTEYQAHENAGYIYLAGFGCEVLFNRQGGLWRIAGSGICWMS